jgi:hypothetical protein
LRKTSNRGNVQIVLGLELKEVIMRKTDQINSFYRLTAAVYFWRYLHLQAVVKWQARPARKMTLPKNPVEITAKRANRERFFMSFLTKNAARGA